MPVPNGRRTSGAGVTVGSAPQLDHAALGGDGPWPSCASRAGAGTVMCVAGLQATAAGMETAAAARGTGPPRPPPPPPAAASSPSSWRRSAPATSPRPLQVPCCPQPLQPLLRGITCAISYCFWGGIGKHSPSMHSAQCSQHRSFFCILVVAHRWLSLFVNSADPPAGQKSVCAQDVRRSWTEFAP